MEMQAVEDEGELRRKRPSDSCPMPIVFPVFQSCRVIRKGNQTIKVTSQLINGN